MATINVNGSGRSKAAGLIRSGNVNRTASWSFSSSDGNAILGDPPNWSRYASWHLGKRPGEDPETKAAWAYPFGKGGNLYRSALVAIRQRAGQQGHDAVFAAAGTLLERVDAGQEDSMSEPRFIVPPKFMSRQRWDDAIADRSPGEPTPPLRKFVIPEIKLLELDADSGMHDIEFIISTGALDRENDILEPDGWDLEAYQENPVVLWSHDYSIPPIAKSVAIGQKDGKLVSVNRFTPPDVNPLGATVYRLVAGGFLRAASVGFRPIEFVFNEDHKGYDFKRQELLEHSVVSVPANPEALAAAKSVGIDLDPIRQWAERVLDEDPQLVRVVNYVPRSVIEDAWKETSPGSVAVTQIATGTDGIGHVDNGSSTDVRQWTTTSWPTGEGYIYDTETGEPLQPATPNINPDEEVDMEQLEKLTEAVDDLRTSFNELKEAIDVVLEQSQKDDASDGDITPDDVRKMVTSAIEEDLIAKTGRLPD